MAKWIRLTTICLLALGALVVAVTSRPQTRPPIVEELAKTYGLDSWGQVDAARYTFNVELAALKVNFSRSWTWEPKTGQVSYEGKDKEGKPVKVTYNRSQLNSAPANVKEQIEPMFVNDNYWFIFPFHVYWDKSANVTVTEKEKLPIGKGTATLVSVKYAPEVGGYTPGDTWNLFVGPDKRVDQFIFLHGGSAKPSKVIATWVGYKKAGPLLVSTEHRGTADGGAFHLSFTNVAVKLAGSDAWVDAK
jgi:hypothetical protein